MKKYILLILICGMLSACVEIKAPVRAVTAQDEVFIGESKATLIEGSVNIASNNGVKCHGTFDQFAAKNPLMMYISCSDGRHGTITAIRDIPFNRPSGTGEGEWSDGTKFTFAFGQQRIREMNQ